MGELLAHVYQGPVSHRVSETCTGARAATPASAPTALHLAELGLTSNILTKLGMANRAEIAAWWVRSTAP